jgi:chromosome segregation ATPase
MEKQQKMEEYTENLRQLETLKEEVENEVTQIMAKREDIDLRYKEAMEQITQMQMECVFEDELQDEEGAVEEDDDDNDGSVDEKENDIQESKATEDDTTKDMTDITELATVEASEDCSASTTSNEKPSTYAEEVVATVS